MSVRAWRIWCAVSFGLRPEDINTATPGGKLVFHILAAIAEFERGIILERTRAT
jgi:DNA invertase Pin-like site-specific DNA recombinase